MHSWFPDMHVKMGCWDQCSAWRMIVLSFIFEAIRFHLWTNLIFLFFISIGFGVTVSSITFWLSPDATSKTRIFAIIRKQRNGGMLLSLWWATYRRHLAKLMVAGEYRGGTVEFIDATVPKQNPGTQDCGAFVIYYAIQILMVINFRCCRCVLCIHCAFFPHFSYSLFWGTSPTL